LEFINYKNSILNLSNSILKYFDINTYHETLKEVDEIFSKNNYKNFVIFVCDGLGTSSLDYVLDKNSFLRRHKLKNITSVFPTTTTAATTSFLTGLYPSEHNWYGWDMYFEDTNETISLFLNKIKETNELPKLEVLKRNYMKYESIIDLINNKTKHKAYYAYPFYKENPCRNLDEVCKRIVELTTKPGKKFIYSYIESPDKEMHHFGTKSNEVKEVVNVINDKIENLSKKLKDTLIIITADHGQVDTKTINLKKDLPDIFNMLERTTSLEPRACGMKLKSDVNHEKFKELFDKHFKNDFICLTPDEVINSKLFGANDNNYLRDTIGDYLLIGIQDKSINYDDTSPTFIGNHAGLTKEEILVPLIIIDCK